MTARQVPRCKVPCPRCPWRKDVEPGEFPASRYEELRVTSEQRAGAEPGFGAPLFACHKTKEGREWACAGWLAAVGHRHLGVRLAIAQGPYRWQVEVTIHGPLAEIARRLPRTAVTLTAQPVGVRMQARVERLDGMAHLLASLEWPFTIHRPDELRPALKHLADQLTTAAERTPGELPR
ncbi:DUF6283 family protein [Streptomyces sp. NPDC052042]|uniref:DUF6283 family protein n=1 Tax=Streptomyces sp. NPDC052042 TaxID=3365683 RepID=UPI0037D7728A